MVLIQSRLFISLSLAFYDVAYIEDSSQTYIAFLVNVPISTGFIVSTSPDMTRGTVPSLIFSSKEIHSQVHTLLTLRVVATFPCPDKVALLHPTILVLDRNHYLTEETVPVAVYQTHL